MGSSSEFFEVFAAQPNAATGMPFADFMQTAMYHPTVGYYTRDFRRVGRERSADFYTATTFSPVFGELVVDAVVNLVAPARPGEFVFVEIGAEPGGGILRDVPHPFASYQTISLGQPFTIPARSIVFSNELFDAQPFHSVAWRRGAWREMGVAFKEGALVEVELPEFSAELAAHADRLPKSSTEDYRIDLPLRTIPILDRIVQPAWSGLFIAFDYGRTWSDLVENFPSGTGRSYFRQRMGDKLLIRPGRQDLTCHICWDWLEDGLVRAGFGQSLVEFQESFLARRASQALARIVDAEARGIGARKKMVMQLLHPANMGQKFQVLHALRE